MIYEKEIEIQQPIVKIPLYVVHLESKCEEAQICKTKRANHKLTTIGQKDAKTTQLMT